MNLASSSWKSSFSRVEASSVTMSFYVHQILQISNALTIVEDDSVIDSAILLCDSTKDARKAVQIDAKARDYAVVIRSSS